MDSARNLKNYCTRGQLESRINLGFPMQELPTSMTTDHWSAISRESQLRFYSKQLRYRLEFRLLASTRQFDDRIPDLFCMNHTNRYAVTSARSKRNRVRHPRIARVYQQPHCNSWQSRLTGQRHTGGVRNFYFRLNRDRPAEFIEGRWYLLKGVFAPVQRIDFWLFLRNTNSRMMFTLSFTVA